MSTHSSLSWPVRLAYNLLVAQAIGLIGGGMIYLLARGNGLNFSPADLSPHLTRLLTSLTAITLGVGLLVITSGFWRLQYTAWLGALSLQSVTLFMALALYVARKPWYSYALMASGICIVLYLHYAEVQNAFRAKRVTDEAANV